MAKRKGQRQEAFEAGERNVLPGQSWLAALARGIGRELSGADMGSPAGQRLREELGSLGYEQALREAFPEDFAMGRAAGSEFIDPLTLFGMRAGVPGRGAARLGGPAGAPRLPPGNVLEGEVIAPARAIEGPLYDLSRPNAPMSPPVSGFEENAVRAMQIARPVPARAGFAYRPEQMASYWEEGGQGLRPSIEDFVPVEVRRNRQEYYSPALMDKMSEEMRTGNRGAMRSEYFGPNADRPPYGEVPEGYVSPIIRRPAPGVGARYEGIPGPAPFGEGAPGKGYFGNLPRPGIRPQEAPASRGGMPARTGGQMPAGQLRYEPVGNLPMMARGGGVPGQGQIPYGMGYRPNFTMQGEGAGGSAAGYSPRGGIGAGLAAAGGMGAIPIMAMMGEQSRRPISMLSDNPLQPSAISPSAPLVGNLDFGAGKVMPEMSGYTGFPQVDRLAEGRPVSKKTRTSAGAGAPMPPRRPEGLSAEQTAAQQQAFNPNFNYYFTQAIDRLLGTAQAEAGRQRQQDVEEYQRKYGPIYYGL